MAPLLATDQVWREVERRFFAVIGYVTPAGEARTTGVDYAVRRRRFYVVVDGNSWKARHIARNPRVSMTVLVPRGGLLALLTPIPPATITMHGTATVLEPQAAPSGVLDQALRGVDPDQREHAQLSQRILEFRPEGEFLTYGIGVSLLRMRHPREAVGRAPVGAEVEEPFALEESEQ